MKQTLITMVFICQKFLELQIKDSMLDQGAYSSVFVIPQSSDKILQRLRLHPLKYNALIVALVANET